MSNAPPQLVTWPHFERELKRLEKKYPHVMDDVREALNSPTTRRDPVPGYAHQLLKVRIPSRDMRRGSRGGFRLYLWIEFGTPPQPAAVYPVTLYPKNERKDLKKDDLRKLLGRFLEWTGELQQAATERAKGSPPGESMETLCLL